MSEEFKCLDCRCLGQTEHDNHLCKRSSTVFNYDYTPRWCMGVIPEIQAAVVKEGEEMPFAHSTPHDIKIDWIKKNLLNLAKFHKELCCDPNCDIQLHAVREAMYELKIELTDEERRILV